ncbi:pancreatic lipase-related protein 2-like [Uranotaenia lowii]|uniref:pancreatic lipase-related protein 2-like n=1 Tax=Uranotaenia lowii TaxID=190385 RepID=UPI00247AB200|nr:pancreatic lipase-related protein 2-like [Uranotaenia lowii]
MREIRSKMSVTIEKAISVCVVILLGVEAKEFSIGPCNFQYLEPCTTDTIEFYLFTSDNPKEAPILLDNIDPQVPDHINLNYSNKLIVHGYGGNIDFNATKMIRNAYLKQPKTNVLVVDWGKLAKLPCYPTAAFNTKQAGECTATFLIGLKANHPEFSCRDLHAIGFSLGAHVLSFTSNALEKSIGIKFRRITGLDPALPFFATARQQWKLDLTDADFVDVIHTNAGVYGKIETCGHVDFYMNGGQAQPMCDNASSEYWREGEAIKIKISTRSGVMNNHHGPVNHRKDQPLCNHMMAAVFFAESINSKTGFWATKCTSYFSYFFGFCRYKVEQHQQQLPGEDDRNQENGLTDNNEIDSDRILMGEHCAKTANGVYFVQTQMKPPYAMGY